MKYRKIIGLYSLIFILVVLLTLGGLSVNAESSENNFESITMTVGESINQMSEEKINSAYRLVKRKMFGQEVATIYNIAWFNYIGETVFSKTNLTREPISMEFQVKETTCDKIVYDISVDVNAKAKASIKKVVDLEVSGKISVDKKSESDYTKLEATKMDLTIEPGYRLILRSSGTGTLANGVGKSFSFFVTTKKYTWEVYEIKTATYELVEEKVN